MSGTDEIFPLVVETWHNRLQQYELMLHLNNTPLPEFLPQER